MITNETKYFARIIVLVIAIILLQINILKFSQPEIIIPPSLIKEYLIYFKAFPHKHGLSYVELLKSMQNYHVALWSQNAELLAHCSASLVKLDKFLKVKHTLQVIVIPCYFYLLYTIYVLEHLNYTSDILEYAEEESAF